MKGLPKFLNTKEDYLYVRDNFPKEQYAPFFYALLDTRMDWFFVGILQKEEDGIEDATHRIEKVNQAGELNLDTLYQYELKENPNCKLLQLGFTVKEVEDILNE